MVRFGWDLMTSCAISGLSAHEDSEIGKRKDKRKFIKCRTLITHILKLSHLNGRTLLCK
jgi:hypothetical protein